MVGLEFRYRPSYEEDGLGESRVLVAEYAAKSLWIYPVVVNLPNEFWDHFTQEQTPYRKQ